jgi:hypothetical protein
MKTFLIMAIGNSMAYFKFGIVSCAILGCWVVQLLVGKKVYGLSSLLVKVVDSRNCRADVAS